MPTIAPSPSEPELLDAPRIEVSPLNLWDSFNPRELENGDDMRNLGGGIRLRLFGNRNIGTTMRTNILQAGIVERDTEYVIANWYARTNILTPPDEFHAFANSTIVTFTVGEMPCHRIPLADLLRRKEGDPTVVLESRDVSDALAKSMYVANHDPDHSQNALWHQLREVDRRKWRRVAVTAQSMVSPAILALIPQRQNYDVIVTADKRALGALLEVLPTNVAPETLVWIHLEGVRRRAA